ncbi:glucosamine--fructose-6-phosphate aminotransferase (isomerizing) [Acetitomaculum ruminis DSM 5522]|uniref:Glutamine--fructose-6-phosphate aminotransferase [isomerizing] n=1 Tax=Acetitomaculum ruminis DSM 5522 TaxID=1120918 RepID=A0A1I0WKA9_9FIRM|nr:glutamine--fructose-6-phosphate transaminase (isomerizing) [Acetitomaculum ruminis]SFA88580.1 glucosamine--fructose-6-phosphate aminotransferase (isomerizing) [Acetitomaculum ruminis DSM 5522]
MCGIIGYTGTRQAAGLLIKGLASLEYRGYDSAGVAIAGGDSKDINIYKCVGKVANLREKVENAAPKGTCGIGHTRWATHGGVTDVNAHPHRVGKVTVTHNGIIENFKELIKAYNLADKLVSGTDTEVACAVINNFYNETENIEEALVKAVDEFKGTYSFTVLVEDEPGAIYAVRNVSPVVVAKGEDGCVLASDITALTPFSKEYFVLPEETVLKLTKDEITVKDFNGNEVEPEYCEIDWDVNAASKNGYPFFMEKEIAEQPKAIKDTIEARITDDIVDFSKDGIPEEVFKNFQRLYFIGCGTAMHSGLVGKSLLQQFAGAYSNVEIASEFIYDNPVLDENTLVIAISQSGETIDTLEAVKMAKKMKATTISIINVRESSIAKASDYVIYTNAGPEIAVASTKAYSVQVAVMYLLTVQIAMINGKMTLEEGKAFIKKLRKIPDVVEEAVKNRETIHNISRKIIEAKDLFMLGRGLDYSAILEGSLKLKEISYIHSEAYSSGEIKHGTIALITQDTPVIAVVTQNKLASKELSNAIEVRSRGAKVILFVKDGIKLENEEEWYEVVRLRDVSDEFMIFPVTVALQLLAYYTSLDKGLDVDKPRNLAKVVTVE